MLKAIVDTKKYFQAPQDYFWRWGDNGEVIEWPNGKTICYKRELGYILKESTQINLPSLGAVILLITPCLASEYDVNNACEELAAALKRSIRKDNESSDEAIVAKRLIQKEVESSDEVIEYYIHRALEFMLLISRLPVELKRRQRSMHLLYEVFGEQKFTPAQLDFKDAVDELNSGRLDEIIFKAGPVVSKEQFKRDLQYLSDALQKFPTVESLELKLRTGLTNIPERAELNLPENSPLDLFDQLAEDPKTVGISRLAKRLIAALNIPMHSQGSSDQSYGGISDITNRGNYDKLLLSELAHDDVSLTARLVNNEALYYRREEPPDNPKHRRTILIDTTLKMWGVPRAFALSAALACTHNTKHGELVEVFTLGGEQFKTIDLYTKEGIMQSQEMLHHSLHCGKALQAIINEVTAPGQNDFIFITDAALLNSPAFHAHLSQVKESLNFILTVSRTGELQFYECIKGRTKLLSTAKFDLDELLFAKPVKRKRLPGNQEPLLFITSGCDELYFPTVGFNPHEYNVFYHSDIGVVGITPNNRILHWPIKDAGALEIETIDNNGNCFFGYNGKDTLTIVLKNNQHQFLALYTIVFENRMMKSFTRDANNISGHELQDNHGYFFLKSSIAQLARPDIRFIKKHINNGYSVLLRVENIYISNFNEIMLDGHNIMLSNNSFIKISAIKQTHHSAGINALKQEEEIVWKENEQVKFEKWVWPDGSEAVIDSRGLLHLKSSDASLPEISIVLALGKTTACLATDGTLCGSGYFLNTKESAVIPAPDFYKRYIQTYIDRIQGS